MAEGLNQEFKMEVEETRIEGASIQELQEEKIPLQTEILDKANKALGLVIARVKSGKFPDLNRIADLKNSATFEPTEEKRDVLSNLFTTFILQNALSLFIYSGVVSKLGDGELYSAATFIGLIVIYFGVSAVFVLKPSFLGNDAYTLINIAQGLVLGMGLASGTIFRSFVYTNIGVLFGIYVLVFLRREATVSISMTKQTALAGSLIIHLLMIVFIENGSFFWPLFWGALHLLYALEIVNLVSERISDYNLDSEVRDSYPSKLCICLPARAYIDLFRKLMKSNADITVGRNEEEISGLN